MPKFRKKPVVIEAFQWTVDEIPDWWREASGEFAIDVTTGSVFIPTLEGIHEARATDWIIKEPGGLYVISPKVFERIYERVVNFTDGLQTVSDEVTS